MIALPNAPVNEIRDEVVVSRRQWRTEQAEAAKLEFPVHWFQVQRSLIPISVAWAPSLHIASTVSHIAAVDRMWGNDSDLAAVARFCYPEIDEAGGLRKTHAGAPSEGA